jgi:NADPH:quinone reductase-like Zn-dependent oxidoreductase
MLAAFYDRFGSTDVLNLGDVPRPEPRRSEVLVRIAASGINPSDIKRRAGWRNAAWPGHRIVPHCDGAGEVVAAGDEEGKRWLGHRVWIWSIPGRTFLREDIEYGTAAEFLAVPVNNLACLPDNVDFATGACLGVPAITAHFTVFADGPVAGKTVLVQGGGGAVGEAAIRMAKQAGAHVVAGARSPARAMIAETAGADLVVDPTSSEAEARIREAAPKGIDRLIEVDFGANIGFASRIIAPGGMIVSYSSTSQPEPIIPYYGLQSKGVVIRLVSNYALPMQRIQEATTHIEAMLEQGTLRPTIAARFPLNAISEAHRAVEGGAIGKVVLTL